MWNVSYKPVNRRAKKCGVCLSFIKEPSISCPIVKTFDLRLVHTGQILAEKNETKQNERKRNECNRKPGMAKRSAAKIDESRGKQPEGHSIDSSPSDSPLADSDSEFSCIPSPNYCRRPKVRTKKNGCVSSPINMLNWFSLYFRTTLNYNYIHTQFIEGMLYDDSSVCTSLTMETDTRPQLQ